MRTANTKTRRSRRRWRRRRRERANESARRRRPHHRARPRRAPPGARDERNKSTTWTDELRRRFDASRSPRVARPPMTWWTKRVVNSNLSRCRSMQLPYQRCMLTAQQTDGSGSRQDENLYNPKEQTIPFCFWFFEKKRKNIVASNHRRRRSEQSTTRID